MFSRCQQNFEWGEINHTFDRPEKLYREIKLNSSISARLRLAFVRNGFIRGAVVFATFAVLAIAPGRLLATEGGQLGSYGVGALTFGSALAPPEGKTWFQAYLLYFSADKFRDDNGKGNLIPDFDLNAFVEVSILKYTWNFKLAGLTVTSGLIQEALHVDVEAGGQQDKATGNSVLGVQPLILAGSKGNLHFLTGSYLFFPAGDYEPDALANSALNYFNYTQEFSMTWLPSPQWMFDLSGNISINGTNHDTDYRSGNVVALTYGAQYRLRNAPKWQIGIGGLYFNQYENDRLKGKDVPGGFRLRKLAGGPQIAYWLTPMSAVAMKWHHDFEVRNGPQGDQFWIQASIPLN